ncbi:ATP-binding protein [Candidatus Atribacteria bacterium 1244-E10-H5-B2]|nr:MAG: ATP-binding protein [Candidatus Atribacteria bacterium 1244-E10-H5-B2]
MMQNIEGREKLKKLLFFHNPWWIDHRVPDSLKLTYRRPVLKKLLEYFKLDRAILIKGPRRTGKTTLLYQIIDELITKREIPAQNIIYLSCDDPELKLLTNPSSDSRINLSDILDAYEQLREKTIKELKPNKKIYLFLDEVHFWKGWQFEIKKYFDKKYPLKFILSGSSASLIKRGSESLMGRTIEELILPFSFYEFLSCQLKDKRLDKIILNLQKNFAPSNLLKEVTGLFSGSISPIDQLIPYQNKIKILFAEYLNRGGFPHLLEVENPILWQRLLREDVIEKVIYRDLVDLYEIKKPQVLEKFFLYLAGHSSDIINITSIANSLCLSREYTLKYLNYLIESFLVFGIKKYSPSVEKQIRSNQKVHLIDSGLITVFGEGNKENRVNGQKVESLVGRCFLKEKVFYWREREEVDFVLDVNFLLPVEVKYRNTILLKDLKGIIKFMEKYGVREGIVVSKDLLEKMEQNGKILWLIPAWLFLLMV